MRKVKLLPFFVALLLVGQSCIGQQTKTEYMPWRHPILLKIEEKSKDLLVYYKKDTTQFISTTAIDKINKRIYYFDKYGYVFDDLPLTDNNIEGITKRWISPFDFYDTLITTYIRSIEKAKKNLRTNGANAKFTPYEKQLLLIDDTIKFPTLLSKLINLDEQKMSVEISLTEFHCPDPKLIIEDTFYTNPRKYKLGDMVSNFQGDTTITYYNKIPVIPVYKAILYKKANVIGYYNKNDVLIDVFELNKEKINAFTKGKIDAFLLYRVWLEYQRHEASATKNNIAVVNKQTSKQNLLNVVNFKINYITNIDVGYVVQDLRKRYKPLFEPQKQQTSSTNSDFGVGTMSTFTRGEQHYQLTDPRGNVMAVITDKKIQHSSYGVTVDYYLPDVVKATDYSSFGAPLPGRTFEIAEYRYGYNGKEEDKETRYLDYGMRMYDPYIGRFLSVDPLTKKFPYYSPYQFAGNSPIKFIDIDGMEPGINQPTTNTELKGKEGRMWAANKAFNMTGGEGVYNNSPITESVGTYTTTVDKAKFFANADKSGLNRTVNENSQFLITNENAFKNGKELVNNLMGNWLWGIGPENYVFPENGKFATELKSSIAVGETLAAFAKAGYKDNVYYWGMDFRGEINVDVNSGFTSLEHFLGSVSVKISHVNEQTIKLEIFNVTSLTSGDINKDIFGSKALKSTMRDETTKWQTDHSNISQYFSMTMSTSEAEKLINQFNPKGNEGNR